jgi:ribosomal protein S14
MAASKKGKPADPKVSRAAERSKPAEHLKPCKRTGAFDDLLRSLNLSPACAS